jgi:hypothetical protein
MSQQFEQRIIRLEKSVRFYRLCLAGLLVVFTGLVIMSFDKKNAVPDLIQAKAFQVVDDRGKVMVQLDKERNNGHISTYDPQGKRLVSLITTDGGAGGINTFGRNGDLLFKLTNTAEGGGYMALFNGKGNPVGEMGITVDESGYFRLNDREGKKLVWMTYTQGGGGYLSLSNNNYESMRFSTPDAGGRMAIYNGNDTRIIYLGAQDTKDGNITVWNSTGARLGGLP